MDERLAPQRSTLPRSTGSHSQPQGARSLRCQCESTATAASRNLPRPGGSINTAKRCVVRFYQPQPQQPATHSPIQPSVTRANKGIKMLAKLINPHFRIAGAFRWMIVPLLVITLALATLVAVQSDTAFADGGNDTAPTAQGSPEDCWWVGLPCIIFG